MKRLLVALAVLLGVAGRADAVITITHGAYIDSSVLCADNTLPLTTGSFTPAASDLLVVFFYVTDYTSTATITDSQSGAYTLVDTTPHGGTSQDRLYAYVRTTLITSSTGTTVTGTVAASGGTGCAIDVIRIAGMARAGTNAIKNAAKNFSGVDEAPWATFNVAVTTSNPTVGALVNSKNPAQIAPPTDWTELLPTAPTDDGFPSPNAGTEFIGRVSGFADTTVTWGAVETTNWAVLVVELDASALPGGSVPLLMLLGVGGV